MGTPPLTLHQASKAPDLSRIDSDEQLSEFETTNLNDLRRCQRKTFRKILQQTINARNKNQDIRKPVALSVDGLIMLMGINR